MGEAEEGRKLAIIFDANIVIASLIREGGLNRYIVTLTPIFHPSYHPEILRREVSEHIPVIAQKAGRLENEISMALESILGQLREIESKELFPFIEESIRYVNDEEDSLYVAAALYLRKSFKQVVIITWNKKDFKFWQLVKRWIRVLTPREFYVNYLKPVFSPQLTPSCLACAVDQLDSVIRATLLYLNESDYIVTEHLPDGSIELETYCHRVLIKREEEGYAICPQILDIKECREIYEKPMNEERMRSIMEAYKICKPRTR